MNTESKFSKKELDKRFEEIFENETRYGIIMAIRTFGPMNIKLLARIMGKTVSTIHHHITEMTKKPKLIIVDDEKTTSARGIYYKLSAISEERFPKNEDTVYEEEIPTIMERAMKLSDEEISKVMLFRLLNQPDLGVISMKMRRSRNYNHNIENFIINGFERTEQALAEGLKPKNLLYPLGAASNISLDMRVSKPRHSIEISMVLTRFFAELVKLNKKIKKEMDEEGVPEDDRIKVYYQLFGGEVADFEFVKDDSFDLQKYIEPVKKIVKTLYEGIDE
jgi:DNA-binding MarR family transcriptional regulator